MIIRPLLKEDYTHCAQIYQDGLDTGMATFETIVPDWVSWDVKFLKQCRFVAIKEEVILGWVALTPFSTREVYKGVAEVTLYISKTARGKGIGRALLMAVIKESERAGFWTLQAKIFAQNEASIALFQKCGFRIVGVREKLAMRDGIWHDNVLLERRSELFYVV